MIITRGLGRDDRPRIEALLVATSFFNEEELRVAMELVDDRLAAGTASHYRFLVARDGAQAIGYACWGPIPGTAWSADFYWLAVHPQRQGQGVGGALLAEVEAWIREEGRRRVYLDTSGRAQYEPTRAFYLANGYEVASILADYYAPGDGKFTFVKVLTVKPS